MFGHRKTFLSCKGSVLVYNRTTKAQQKCYIWVTRRNSNHQLDCGKKKKKLGSVWNSRNLPTPPLMCHFTLSNKLVPTFDSGRGGWKWTAYFAEAWPRWWSYWCDQCSKLFRENQSLSPNLPKQTNKHNKIGDDSYTVYHIILYGMYTLYVRKH